MELVPMLHFGLITVILIAGMAQAVRTRHRLGSRASSLLVAGAGLLLLMHLIGLLWPLLHNAILDGGFLGYPELLEATSVLRFLLSAAGVGLIIAAVFAGRPVAAQDEPTAGEPIGDQPSPPGNRGWTVVAAVAAALALAAAASWFVRATQAESALPGRVTEELETQRCLNTHTPSAQLTAEPVEAMLLRKGDGWLRVYVSKPDNWIIACQGGPQASMGAFATVMDDGTPGKLLFFGGYDSVLKGHLLLGELPNGGAFVEARLPDGRRIEGDHNGDIFVIWAPGVSVEGAQVTVLTGHGEVIITATAPTEQG